MTTPDNQMNEVVAKLVEALSLLQDSTNTWKRADRPSRVANQASMCQNIIKSIDMELKVVEGECDEAGCAKVPYK